MTPLGATLGPTAYWYLTRATGAVALLLLSASMIIGVLGTLRFSVAPRWPRFAVDALHRDVSLLAIAFVALHVITTVLDGFAPITLLDGVIPFRSPYRPLWLGLGTASLDLMLAVVVTSLFRRRLGYRSWRAIHWLAYASWPVAVLHGLGTGSDVKSWWMLALTGACVAAVVTAALARIRRADPGRPRLRAGAVALSVAVPIGIGAFALAGPLQRGWARRAGTPAKLLASSAVSRQKAPASTVTGPRYRPFSARVSGTVSQDSEAGGAIVQLMLRMSGGVSGKLRVRLGGTPVGSDGLSMTGSQVDLATAGMVSALAGRISSLDGDRFVARVSDGSSPIVVLEADLNIDQSDDTVTGTVIGRPESRTR